mmetsp:Transcript_31620/g.63075  ORF Transcript_31620/g.63075 Transcript_31620/m.63075 type:complete len:90 (+) Transcript_31620:2667-2936(+)
MEFTSLLSLVGRPITPVEAGRRAAACINASLSSSSSSKNRDLLKMSFSSWIEPDAPDLLVEEMCPYGSREATPLPPPKEAPEKMSGAAD